MLVAMGCRGPGAEAPAASAPERVALSDGWLAMGTFFEIDLRVDASRVEAVREWIRAQKSEISRLERIYSRHDPESELSELNRFLEGRIGSTTVLGPELARLLHEAQGDRLDTQGAFDFTIGPLVEIWSEAARAGRWPSREVLAQARERVGPGGFTLSREGRVEVRRSGGRIDLDALSKGAVLDHLRERFERLFPGDAALFSFGQSSVIALGDPGGGGWKLALHSSDPARGLLGEIRLRDQAFSMSSSLGSLSQIGDRRVAHVIDPRTGQPVAGSLESAVIADSARRADAWSTALLVLGASRESLEWAMSRDLEVWVMDAEGERLHTPGWPVVVDQSLP